MAKNNNELQRYLQLLERIRSGKDVSSSEMSFFAEFTADVDDTKMQALLDSGDFSDPAQVQAALQEASVALQTNPNYKDKILEAAATQKGQQVSDKISQGLTALLGASDIAQSAKQISASNSALKKSRKPSRPAVPQRDLMLQNALRSAEQGTFDAGRALAPVKGEIQDQYNSDIANAKTASTGQSGAFGAYAQLAANRRNRAAMEMAPIQDSIRSREQQRYDALLGARADETQQMFQNQAALYPHELAQYNVEQQAAASLGAQGRENLRNSVYNAASQIPSAIGNEYAKRKYRNLYNQMSMYGDENANIAVKNAEYLDNQQQFTPWM